MFDWLVRPKNDNGIGLHDDGVSGPVTMPRMYSLIDKMQDKNAHWLTLVMNVTREKLPLIRYAQDRDIMVLVRPFEQPCHPTSRIQEWFVKACMDYGAVYFIDWNEPNLGDIECTKPYPEYKYNGITGHTAFVNRLADQWLADADTVRRCGGIPLLFPMSPTAYTSADVFYHHRLYEELVGLLKLRGNLHWAFEKTGIAIHNRPCDGMLLDKMDRCAFRDYEWIEALFKNALGYEIPLFGTESGYESGMVDKYLLIHQGINEPSRLDRTIWLDWHKKLNHEIFKRMNPAHPKAWHPYLICQNMWLSHDGPASYPGSGWALNQMAHGEAPAFRDMHEIPYFVRAKEQDPKPEPKPKPKPEEPMEIEGAELIKKYNLTIEPCALPGHRIVKLAERCEAANCDVWAQDANGNPISGMAVRWGWPGTEVSQITDSYGRAGFAMSKGAYYDPAVSGGPHWTAVTISQNSEVLRGIGMIAGTVHCTANPTFRYCLAEPQPQPEPEPPPPPPPEPYKFVTAVNKRLKAANLPPLVDMRTEIETKYANLNTVGKRGLGPDDLWSITFHHDAITGPLSVLAIANEHVNVRGYPHISYHFIIGKDGKVYFCKQLKHYSAQCGNNRMNRYAIAVAVHGDFTKEKPTEAQLKALALLVESLEEFVGGGWGKCHPLPIIRHIDVVVTECPGSLYEDYRKYLLK